MTTDDREREMRLKAAELHDVAPTARKIYRYDYVHGLLGPCVRLSFDPMRESYKKEGIQYVDLVLESGRLGLFERTWNKGNDLTDDTVALLQRAKEIMGGGA